MAFFSSNLALTEESSNPKISRIYEPSTGGQPLGDVSISDNPLQQLANALSGGGVSAGYSDLGNPYIPELPSGPAPIAPLPGQPYNPTDPTQPTPTQPIQSNVSDGGGVAASMFSGVGGSAAQPTSADVASYLENRNAYQFAGGLFGGLLGGPLGANLVQAGMDYNYGLNTTGLGPTFTSRYTQLGGPGSSGEYTGGVMTPSEQRDMLIQQIAFSEPNAANRGFFSSLFGDPELTYDPEMDLTNVPWQEFQPMTQEQLQALGWAPTTVESVVSQAPAPVDISSQWETTPGSEQSQMLAEQEAGMDTTTAGGYTWSDSDWGSVAEAQEDTGIGTSEWDSSAEGFSWDDSGDSGDSGGGDSGGGGSYIATAATQALGEEGLKVFEDWRDYMFKVLPTFKSSFGRYRATAPKIVAEIDNKDNSKNIYSWIWDMHLKPIFDMIKEDKDSKKALKDYKVMVRELSNKFLSKEK